MRLNWHSDVWFTINSQTNRKIWLFYRNSALFRIHQPIITVQHWLTIYPFVVFILLWYRNPGEFSYRTNMFRWVHFVNPARGIHVSSAKRRSSIEHSQLIGKLGPTLILCRNLIEFLIKTPMLWLVCFI